MPILTTQQSLTVGDVTNIVVTPLVRDEDTGEFVRELRIFAGDGGQTSPLDPPSGSAPITITLRLTSPNRAALHIAVPPSEF
jgi:hypothetical protein